MRKVRTSHIMRNQLNSLVYDWEVTVRDVCAPVPIISYGLHKEQLKAGARGNSSLTLHSWNEFVVATETSTARTGVVYH